MAERELTVIGHLDELRRRIIIALIAVVAAAAVCAPLAPRILTALTIPAQGAITKLVYFSPEESFVIYMRISLLAGLCLAFPVIAYQAWAFVSPAIDGSFKKHAVYIVAVSSLAFTGGCVFAFAALLPAALTFLLSIGQGQLEPVISASRYISFVLGFMLACGVVFEMPVASYFLARMGLVSARFLRRKFKYAVVCIAIAAAVITPTGDIVNMLLLAVPMLALYEISIWIAFLAEKRRVPYAAEALR